MQWAVARGLGFIQRQRLVEVAAPDRLEVMQPAESKAPGQCGSACPARRGHRGSEMPASGVTGHPDPGGIESVRIRLAMHPLDGRAALTHHLIHAHCRHQRVVDVDHRHPVRHQAQRHAVAGGFIQCHPVAAMDIDQHRPGAPALRHEEVQPLAAGPVIDDLFVRLELGPCTRAARDPASNVTLLKIRHLGAVVVLRIECSLVVVTVDGWGHGICPEREGASVS